MTAFNYKNVENINIVYPKKKISKTDLLKNLEIIFNNPIEKTLTRKFTKRKTPLPVNLDEEEAVDETENPQETETTVENENIIEVDEEYYEKQYEDNKWRYKIPRQFENKTYIMSSSVKLTLPKRYLFWKMLLLLEHVTDVIILYLFATLVERNMCRCPFY